MSVVTSTHLYIYAKKWTNERVKNTQTHTMLNKLRLVDEVETNPKSSSRFREDQTLVNQNIIIDVVFLCGAVWALSAPNYVFPHLRPLSLHLSSNNVGREKNVPVVKV